MRYINANYIEERYTILISLIYTIKEEKLRVSLEVGKRVRVSKKNSYNPAILYKLNSALKALLIELVSKRLN